MKSKNAPGLSIFDTFKTKGRELTGEATRQRSIIAALATQSNPAERTRTAISQRIAGENGTVWKNIYSGIFRDLDEILIPLDVVEEDGRLPLKRGPKALQEKGIPYYKLTPKGLLVFLSLDGVAKKEMLKKLLDSTDSDKQFGKIIIKLADAAPGLVHSLLEKYVRAYCDGVIDSLLPLGFDSFKSASDESVVVLKEFVKSFADRSKADRDDMMDFLEHISPVAAKH